VTAVSGSAAVATAAVAQPGHTNGKGIGACVRRSHKGASSALLGAVELRPVGGFGAGWVVGRCGRCRSRLRVRPGVCAGRRRGSGLALAENVIRAGQMSVLGGMSDSERQHVQARVRAAMDAQVINEGVSPGRPGAVQVRRRRRWAASNPRKAAEGYRLRVLTVEDETAAAVQRIFAEDLDGIGDRAIANGLNRDGIACPSANRPEQNRHRQADGWQGSTVRAILDNPRYTGYASFGRWTKHETLLDPDDAAPATWSGSGVRLLIGSCGPGCRHIRRLCQWRRSRQPNYSGGQSPRVVWRRLGRLNVVAGLQLGHICCEGWFGAGSVIGRCRARRSAAVRTTGARSGPRRRARRRGPDHPKTVNLREDLVVERINGWLGRVFHPDNVDETVATLLGAQPTESSRGPREAAKQRLADAEARVRRYQAAIGAGVDPAALVEVMNQAQAERTAARVEVDRAPDETEVSRADVYAMIETLGDIGAVIKDAKPAGPARLYRKLDLQMVYNAEEQAVYVTSCSRVGNECVRGGT
jgi:hypothetical protein